MAEYAFVTTWRIDAPIEAVYDVIEDSLAWPEWWDAVLAVEELEHRDGGIGSVRRYTFKGRLPYLLRFDTTTDVLHRPERLGGAAVGELEGRGDWLLVPDGPGATLVRYEWTIRTTRRWMNAIARLPFVRAIFVLNHDDVMNRGLAGIRRRLGVAGQNVPHEAIPTPARAVSASTPADGAGRARSGGATASR